MYNVIKCTVHFKGNNETLLAELYKEHHSVSGFEVLYEAPAEPGHYLTLSHIHYKHNGSYMIS